MIQDPKAFYVFLDINGKQKYHAMRTAENEWLHQVDGQVFWEIGPQRQSLAISYTKELPDYTKVETTKSEFLEHIQELAKGQGKILTAGSRTTKMPEWLTPQGKVSVLKIPMNMKPVKEIRYSTQNAWRGSWLAEAEVYDYFESKIKNLRNSIEVSRHHNQKGRISEYEERIEGHREEMRAIDESYQGARRRGRLFGRIYSGSAWKYLLKTESEAWSCSIATIGVVYGSEETTVRESFKRARKATKEFIRMVGNVGLFVDG